MALSTRNTKLILRSGVMVMAALTLGLAVRLVLENHELETLLPATSTRTALLLIAPLTSLSILHFSLAVRSFTVRSLAFETVELTGEATLLVSIVSPLLVGRWINTPPGQCTRWIGSCPGELIWEPLWWIQPVSLAISALLIVGATACELRRSRVKKAAPRSRAIPPGFKKETN